MKWSAHDITWALVRYDRAPFSYTRNLCVAPNIWHGFGLRYEADLVALSKAKYMSEVEIKVSRADFVADAKKYRHMLGLDKRTKAFWYAMPDEVWQKCGDVWRVPGSGVITVGVEPVGRHGHRRLVCRKVIEAERTAADPVSDADVLRFMRLAAMRVWGWMPEPRVLHEPAPLFGA